MKLCVASSIRAPIPEHEEPAWDDFASSRLDDAQDDRPTQREPYSSSPALEGLVNLTSEVRMRAAARAEAIARRSGR